MGSSYKMFKKLSTSYVNDPLMECFFNESSLTTVNLFRQKTLDGLKKNWEELHLQYQGLSVVTDTAPKKAR